MPMGSSASFRALSVFGKEKRGRSPIPLLLLSLHIDYESFTLYESSVINPYSLYEEYE